MPSTFYDSAGGMSEMDKFNYSISVRLDNDDECKNASYANSLRRGCWLDLNKNSACDSDISTFKRTFSKYCKK